ncbi:MAG: peptidylprolyl isomerase [Gemmatimonadales bacterium]|nr:MAG: peptidylprolyl isomerase [Gemmatimonadales bacterium]
MAQASSGDTVHIHYTGRLDDGTVFDTSQDRDPLAFVLGEGQVIPGFESAVEGMETGDSRTATIPSEKAYGPRREDLVMPVPREHLPDGLEVEVGMPLEMRTAEGQTARVVVAEVEEEQIRIDANHPLAGRDLTFDIELVKVEPAGD